MDQRAVGLPDTQSLTCTISFPTVAYSERKAKMTIKKTATSALALAALALSGCAASEKPLTSMSCTELAIEIGKMTQARDEAAMDSAAGALDVIIADTRAEEIEGGVDALIGDVSGAMAQGKLSKLNRVFVQKGCR
ncbi:hypothetical protein PhaeoP72_04031 (plasmid) [Phaeobacter inhibens]|uniref:hypothetical protein n=1 Tax=Phaeobacter inhibens TaxID=221822 RepID=UPI000CA0EFF6|nr:hypothetical protein [Phaeobacter inhibens]AUQ54782.1 hypothetical protein PhaeoP92_02115 [Phaeobacter inhibens]AUQ78798.1 hypothetical protein PhaeoP74_02116 [Phaeobacter inhibens]AUR05949.1 hypothetical protein PhaeoP72_04031 [Phaeobacter inhibens]AUR15957.1 hypothetical protein PhaeoP70_02114 [Phaeobacter inhibens]